MIMLKDKGQVFFSYLLPHSRLSASGRCIGYRGSDYLLKLRPMLALNVVLMLACVYFNFLDGAVTDPAQRFYATEFVVIAYLLVKASVLPVKAFEPGPHHEIHPVAPLVWLELGTHFGLVVALAAPAPRERRRARLHGPGDGHSHPYRDRCRPSSRGAQLVVPATSRRSRSGASLPRPQGSLHR
jgi:hypothetical protein